MLIAGLVFVALSAVFGFIGARYVREHAVELGLVQAPNGRSSHTIPTPSGGGVGIVAGGTLGAAGAALLLGMPVIVVAFAGLALAWVGFRDDIQPMPARIRLAVQFLSFGAALLALVPLDAMPTMIGLPLPALVILPVLFVVGVYWINAYNFMDGIDGLAGSQAVFMTAAGALLVHLAMPDRVETWWLLTIGGASAGFLVLNWPPAKVFMGDVASYYLGLMIAVLALATAGAGLVPLCSWIILAALFVTDTMVTLVRRLLLRERLFDAHRRHAYQFLSRRFGSHRTVTAIYMGINLVWVLPLAVLAQAMQGFGPLLTVIAYLPLVGLALYSGAGRPEHA